MTGANERMFEVARAFDAFAGLGGKRHFFAVSERLTRELSAADAGNLYAWFGTLQGGAPLPPRPSFSSKVSEGRLYFGVTTELPPENGAAATDNGALKENPAQSVTPQENPPRYYAGEPTGAKLYYAYGGSRKYRNWCEAVMSAAGEGEYIAAVPVYDKTTVIYAYARVFYKDGVSVCGRMIAKTGGEFAAVVKPYVKNQLIYSGEFGCDTFTTVNNRCNIHKTEDIFIDEGPFGIQGATNRGGRLATYKLCDARYAAEPGRMLMINMYGRSKCPCRIVIADADGAEYAASITLNGGDNWQKLALNADDFKSDDMRPLPDFTAAALLYFHPADENARVIVSNMLWA
jgi:hypothetical protein